MLRYCLAALFALLGTAAQANWRVATSAHFAVYTQEGEATARGAAERLEKFEYVLRFLTQTSKPASPVRVTVFLVTSEAAVQATMPFGGAPGVAGYYSTNARGPYAIMSRSNIGTQNSGSREFESNMGLGAQHILLHELTHHFMFQYYPAAYPTWYAEGFADYIGSMQFLPNDVVTVGAPVANRYLSLQSNRWLPVQQLLTAKSYADVPEVDLLYAEGWLLVHYLSNTDNRPGQLKAFLNAINAGQPFDKAAVSAFGDLDKLDSELRAYSGRGRLPLVQLPFRHLDPGEVTVHDVSPAQEALIGYDMRLYSGVPQSEAPAFADRVERAAKPFADEPYALSLVFEAQRLAGRVAPSGQTAAHWVQLAPTDPRAIAADADARADALAASGSRDAAAWADVRKLYARSLKLAPNQARTLRHFYDTYRRQGTMPPESAQNALYAAYELQPQDSDLRQAVAADFEMRNMLDDAIVIIRPVAVQLVDLSELSPGQRAKRERDRLRYRMAGEDDTETAREMLTRLEAKKAKAAAATH